MKNYGWQNETAGADPNDERFKQRWQTITGGAKAGGSVNSNPQSGPLAPDPGDGQFKQRWQTLLKNGMVTGKQAAEAMQGGASTAGAINTARVNNTAGAPETADESGDADWQQTVNDIYDNMLKAQQDKLNAQYHEQQTDYDKQKGDALKTYDPLNNQAYVNNAMAEKTRKEAMANMGLSGAGGTSQTAQQSNTNSLLGTLGDISRQKQDYTDNINLALGKLSTQYNSDTGSLAAQTESDRNKALLDQGNFEDTFGLQQQQQSQSEKDSTFNQAWQLLKAHRITKAEFEAMTGVTLK